ncbi:hypothetical protein AAG570_002436, partial [Ranatra chinensis]
TFRHGQRAPADTFPTDPHINQTFAPNGWGQLTNEGKMQQYEQGQFLKKRYGHFVGGQYRPELIEAWTTDVDRTKMSMQLMMAGLLPPSGEDVWNKDLNWQPVPSSHEKLSKDTLLLVRGCPRYAEAMDALLKDPEIKTKLDSYKELNEYLTEKTGMPINTPDDVQSIYSTLKAEEDYGLELPEWTKSVYPEKMKEATEFSFIMNAYTRELQKIKGGPLIKKILEDAKAKAEEKSQKRLYAYAGHDSTISNVLLALKMWDPQVPVYNIMIIFELHQIEDKYGLKVFLRNTTTHEPYPLTMPGCQHFCPLDEVVKLSEDIIPDKLTEACKAKDSSYTPPKDSGP